MQPTEHDDAIEALQEIHQLLEHDEPERQEDETEQSWISRKCYRRGFLEGRAWEITRGLDEHPKWWDGRVCHCDACMDAVADYC